MSGFVPYVFLKGFTGVVETVRVQGQHVVCANMAAECIETRVSAVKYCAVHSLPGMYSFTVGF